MKNLRPLVVHAGQQGLAEPRLEPEPSTRTVLHQSSTVCPSFHRYKASASRMQSTVKDQNKTRYRGCLCSQREHTSQVGWLNAWQEDNAR